MTIRLLAMCLAGCLMSASVVHGRTWRHRDGRTMEGELIAVNDEGVTLKRNSDGKIGTVRTGSLSKEDQDFIKNWSTSRRAESRQTIFTPVLLQGETASEPSGVSAEQLIQQANADADAGSWDEALTNADLAVDLARSELEAEEPTWSGQLSSQLQATIVAYVRSKYLPILHQAIQLAIRIPAEEKPRLDVPRRSARWAINAKSVAREIIGYRQKLRGGGGGRLPRFLRTSDNDLATLQKNLPAKSILVVWVKYEHENQNLIAAWAIPSNSNAGGTVGTKAGAVAMQYLGLADPDARANLEGEAKALHQLVSYKSDLDDAKRQLAVVKRRAFQGLYTLVESYDRWILSPDADLWLVPFVAMPIDDETGEKYVIEKKNVSYSISGREFLDYTALATKGNVKPYVVANPKFDTRLSTQGVTQDAKSVPVSFASFHPASDYTSDVLALETIDESKTIFVCWRNRRRRDFCYPRPRISAPSCVQTVTKGHLLVEELQELTRRETGETLAGFQEVAAMPALIDTIVGAFPTLAEGDIIQQEMATEVAATAIPRKQEEREVVIYCTHGFFLNPNPTGDHPLRVKSLNPLMRCGLAMAGGNTRLSRNPAIIGDDRTDGILTGHELVQHADMKGTNLVVLIACQTAQGQTTHAGGSLASVRHACQMAGARVVLATSWEIAVPAQNFPDPKKHPTIKIVSEFLKSAATPPKAGSLLDYEEMLTDAQRKHLKSDGDKHPYFWAAFSVTGY